MLPIQNKPEAESSILSYSAGSSKIILQKPLKAARGDNKENINITNERVASGVEAYRNLKTTLNKLSSARQTPRGHRVSMA